MAVNNKKIINSIKFLSLDIIENANYGNIKFALNSSSVLSILYSDVLNYNIENHNWINRDRFLLSTSYGNASLYATLYFCGFDFTLDDLRRYTIADSFTPETSDINKTNGIEFTSGLPGYGLGCAAGIAISERYYEAIAKRLDEKNKIVDYYTYVYCTKDEIENGSGYETLTFIAKQKLNKLITIIDLNDYSDDENYIVGDKIDYQDLYESIGFNVIDIESSIGQLPNVIKDAKKSKIPTIILCKPQDNLEIWDSNSKKLDYEKIKDIKQKGKYPLEQFSHLNVKEEIKKYLIDRNLKKNKLWLSKYNNFLTNSKDKKEFIDLLENGEINIDFDSNNYQINDNYYETGIDSSSKAINFIASKTNYFFGGHAGEYSLSKHNINKNFVMSSENITARNINFDNRVSTMGNVLNGMSINGLKTCSITTLINVNKMLDSIRLSCVMNLPRIYVFTHDSISCCKKGSAFEPIEQINLLRSIPNLIVIRPSDINEILGSWDYAIKSKKTVALIISHEKLNKLKHTNSAYVKYGAYIVQKEKSTLDGVLVASGSEVLTAMKIADELSQININIRVVSCVSLEILKKQDPLYLEKLLPSSAKIIFLESSIPLGWKNITNNDNVGITCFGTSGNKDDILKFVDFDYNALLIKIKKMFE